MRLVIIPSDKFVLIDGVGYYNLELSSIGENVHAVQWYGDSGSIEIKDVATGKIVENVDISDISQFQSAIDAWNVADAAEKERIAAEKAAAERLAAEIEAAKKLMEQTDVPA